MNEDDEEPYVQFPTRDEFIYKLLANRALRKVDARLGHPRAWAAKRGLPRAKRLDDPMSYSLKDLEESRVTLVKRKGKR